MKRIICGVLALILALSFCACGKQENLAPTPSGEGTAEETIVYAPWEYDVAEKAKEAGEIHYYFMASHGMHIDSEANHPKKWGDCCLIAFPNGELMLVDGGKGVMIPVIVENLKKMGVEKLDYVVLSHCHGDHGCGIFNEGGVLDNFQVGKAYWNGVKNGGWETPVEELFSNKGVTLELLQKGDVLEIGEVSMEVLWPMPEEIGQSYTSAADINDRSMVMRFDYKDHSSLFVGDLYKNGEGLLVEESGDKLKADLLKAPHHGSPTSGSTAFLFEVNAKIAVATGYQDVEFDQTENYRKMGTELLYDTEHGYIHAWSDGTELQYESEKT